MTTREKLILIEALQIQLADMASELIANAEESLEGLGLAEDVDTLNEHAKDAIAAIEATMQEEMVS